MASFTASLALRWCRSRSGIVLLVTIVHKQNPLAAVRYGFIDFTHDGFLKQLVKIIIVRAGSYFQDCHGYTDISLF